MQRARLRMVALLLAAVAMTAAGCSRSAGSCDNLLTCPEYGIWTAPAGCDGPAEENPDYYTEKCGIFADPEAGAGAGGGTRSAPFATLGAAIAAAIDQRKRVYACARTFKEAVAIKSSVEIVGGLGCAEGWKEAPGAVTTIEGLVDGIALVVDTAGYVSLRRVDVVAPPAVAAGASSIAMLVNGAHVTFAAGHLVASDAADGAPGAELAWDPGLDGLPGAAGRAVCEGSSTNPGATGVSKDCSATGGGTSTSGAGGDGGVVNGLVLEAGENGNGGAPASEAGAGQGGLGEGPSKAESCTAGAGGADGAGGEEGQGGSGRGSISESGYWGSPGKDGKGGAPGQGGGGGGGARGGFAVTCNGSLLPHPGASGGSGGTGGCGGMGGKGGGAGGSSIALISLHADVLLTDTLLVVGRGGQGGHGGAGQAGGAGGEGGNGGAGASGVAPGCQGGAGGHGGAGGAGGGGPGGHSLGVAFRGKTPAGMKLAAGISPEAGPGGAAGANAINPAAGRGADGVAAQGLEFP